MIENIGRKKHLFISLFLIIPIITSAITTIFIANQLNKRQETRSQAVEYSGNSITTMTNVMKIQGNTDIANQNKDGRGTFIENFSKTKNWIGNADSRTDSYLAMRFFGSAIPANAQITSVLLTVTSSQRDWEILKMQIYAEKNSNPQTFSTSSLISTRSLTTAYKTINLDQRWLLDQTYSFDVLQPIQELINTTPNNGYIVLVVKGTSKPFDYYHFYNNQVPDKSPSLRITYTTSSPVSIYPTTIVPSINPTIISSVTPPKSTLTPSPRPTTSSASTPTPIQTGSWWKPTTEKPIHWHWQLTDDFVYPRDVVADVQVYDIDGEHTSAETVAKLHALGPNIKVICYMDAGVYETYRSDASSFPKEVIGNKDIGWDGSYWLDIRDPRVLVIMKTRMLNWCKNKGFDAIEPDETEVWSNNPGFSITKAQNNVYNQQIANAAHELGLSVALKGNTTEAPDLWSYFDFSINEECFQYNECYENLIPSFINHNKAVMNIEYKATPNCTQANQWHMNSAKRDLDLVGPTSGKYLYQPCVKDNVDTW